jgi:hypothetical protein
MRFNLTEDPETIGKDRLLTLASHAGKLQAKASAGTPQSILGLKVCFAEDRAIGRPDFRKLVLVFLYPLEDNGQPGLLPPGGRHRAHSALGLVRLRRLSGIKHGQPRKNERKDTIDHSAWTFAIDRDKLH